MRKIWIILVLGVIFLSILMWRKKMKEDFTYQTYQSKDPRFSFSLKCPKGWFVIEEPLLLKGAEGAFFAFVLREPRSERGPEYLWSGFSLFVWATQKLGGRPEGLEQNVNSFINASRQYKDFRIIADKKTTIDGYKAREVTISYKKTLFPGTIGPQKEYRITEARTFILKGKYIYELCFTGVDADTMRYQKVFQMMKESFRFSR